MIAWELLLQPLRGLLIVVSSLKPPDEDSQASVDYGLTLFDDMPLPP
jgi:hypothetical protein